MDCFVILFGFLKENFVLALIFLPPPRTACNLRWREAAANSKSSCSKPLFSSQILTLNSRSLSYLLGCVGLSGTRVTPPSFLLKLRGQADFHRFKMSCPSSLQHFCLFLLILAVPAFSQSSVANTKVLHVGKELLKETLPLQSGSCLYQLQGLRSNMWYEVKISYPASIPASFSLQLKNASSDPELNFGRKLLNTEKLIFKTDKLESLDDQGGLYVLVSVMPEGVVAIPGAKERKYIIFNIVCDELFFGIPHKAWYVAILVLLCLVIAFLIPSFLPPYLLLKNQESRGAKDS